MFYSLIHNSRDPVCQALPKGQGASLTSLARASRDALSVREMGLNMMRSIYLELHTRIFGAPPYRIDHPKLDLHIGRAMSWCIKSDIEFPTFVAAQMHAMAVWFAKPACKFRVFQPAMLTTNNAIKRYELFQKKGNVNRRDALDGLECYREIGTVRSRLVATEFEVGRCFVSCSKHGKNIPYGWAVDLVRERGLLDPEWIAAHGIVPKTTDERAAYNLLRRMFTPERLADEKLSAFLLAAESVLRSYRNSIPDSITSPDPFDWSDIANLLSCVAPPVRETRPPNLTGIAGRSLWKA